MAVLCYNEHLDVYHYIDPVHHLHINKITCGANLHVTPNTKYLGPLYDG